MTLFTMDALTWALLGVSAVSLLLLVAMIVLRVVRKFHEQHLARLDVRVRPLVLAIAIAEPEELPELFNKVRELRVFARLQTTDTAARMLAEVNGESRRNLSALLTDQQIVAQALRRISSVDPVRRARAAELIGLVNPPSAIDVLTKLSRDRNREVRIVAVRALGRTTDPRAAEPIEAMLRRRKSAPAWISASALLELNAAAGFQLDNFTMNRNPSVRQIANTLASLMPSPDTGQLLIKSLQKDPDRLVRVSAARALGRLQSRVAVAPLAEAAVTDPHRSVRVSAAAALTQLPEVWTAETLSTLLTNVHEVAVRRAAMPPTSTWPAEGI